MEFIKFDEAVDVLCEIGVNPTMEDEDHLRLEVDDEQLAGELTHMHLADGSSAATPRDGSRLIQMEKARLADAVENMIGQLHLAQILVFPVGKWRTVFDAVAFSMASNEDWQEVDTMATVELNTRDPLLCEPGDYHTLHALINALFTDAEKPDQGITLAATARQFTAEIIPDGAIRVTVGSQAMADEIAEGLGAP